MSLISTRAKFEALLADEDARVIALSGRWGTGKTHLWRSIQGDFKDEPLAVVASAFGAADIKEVRLRLFRSALSMRSKFKDTTVESSLAAVKKGLAGFNRMFEALDEAYLIALPAMLRGKIVVIDDVERKGKNLSVHEILGLVDELVEVHSCRVVLILNTGQLDDEKVWETYREKAIDQEITLDTEPAEAFDIAIGGKDVPYPDAIKKAVVALELSNIRVIRRIARVARKLLGDRPDLPDYVAARVVPSIVLLSAAHFRASPDLPEVDFILRTSEDGPWRRYFEEASGGIFDDAPRKEESESERGDKELRAARDLIMRKLGIDSCDQFEVEVARYLRTGGFDAAAVADKIEEYLSDHGRLAAEAAASAFQQSLWWDMRLSDAELVEKASSLLPHAPRWDAFKATDMAKAVADIPGGGDLAAALVKAWIDARAPEELQALDERGAFGRALHPDIKAAKSEASASSAGSMSILDACRSLIAGEGWGEAELSALNGPTWQDYERDIRSFTGPDLRDALLLLTSMVEQPQRYSSAFDECRGRYISACRSIVAEDSRLARLIRGIFDKQHAHLLDAGAAPPASDS